MLTHVNGHRTMAGASFEGHFGYGSKHAPQTWRFEACDGCVSQLLALFPGIRKTMSVG